MKTLNEKHEVIIDSWFAPTKKDVKHGEVSPHQQKVSWIAFYQRQIINDQEVFIKIQLTRDMIMDLSKQIETIESNIVDMPYDELPF